MAGSGVTKGLWDLWTGSGLGPFLITEENGGKGMLGRRRQHRASSELLGVSCLLPDIPSSKVGLPLTSDMVAGLGL